MKFSTLNFIIDIAFVDPLMLEIFLFLSIIKNLQNLQMGILLLHTDKSLLHTYTVSIFLT